MPTRPIVFACAHAALVAVLSPVARGQALGVNLVVNGDAETGSIAGWVDGGIEAVDSAGAGTLGLPPGVSIGDFCFTGFLGPETQTLSQAIDVAARAAQIDAGQIGSTFGVLLQARAVVGAFDSASARLDFRDAAGGAIASVRFEDTNTPIGVGDWESFEDVRVVPTGTRSLFVELTTTRNTGASSDGFMDNVSVILDSDCYPDCDQSTGNGVLDVFDFLCFQNSFVSGETYACDCDTSTGAGVCDVFDFLCFQNAFVGGCP